MTGPPTLRHRLRRAVPFGLRVGLRRAPAVLAGLLRPPPARGRDSRGFAHVQCARSTPLRRQATLYGPAFQAGKEANVRRAAALVDGVTVAPGATFSWHRTVGPPLRWRGFAPGPELHDGALCPGVGGGLCQAANLVYWLAIHSGMEIVERHRHGLDLFPDGERTVPFGLGATVFYPRLDLRFRNPHPWPLRIGLSVEGGILRGEARFPVDPGVRWEVVEEGHRLERRGAEVWRENRLIRRRLGPDGIADELLAENRARVLYAVPEADLGGGGR